MKIVSMKVDLVRMTFAESEPETGGGDPDRAAPPATVTPYT
jgi:hypothetical protein